MLIYIKDNENQTLQIEFTEEDMKQEFFTTTALKVLSKYDGELKDNILMITPTESQMKGDIALLVNDIRQDYMGDVDPEADLKECPRLPFTPEAEAEAEEALIDELGVQDVVSDIDKSAL